MNESTKRKRITIAPFVPVSERKRSHNKIDPSLQEYLEWLSSNWDEQFAEEQQQPSSMFEIVTKLNMVEFVLVDKWSEHWGQPRTRVLNEVEQAIKKLVRAD